MKDHLDTTQIAEVLGAKDRDEARRWMWNHGKDPVDRRGRAFLYSRADVEQVKQERIDWRLDDPTRIASFIDDDVIARAVERQRLREAGLLPSAKKPRRLSVEQIEAMQAGRERARNVQRPSLPSDSQPVSCSDIDYLAFRAGERRRRGQSYGQTEHMMKGAKP